MSTAGCAASPQAWGGDGAHPAASQVRVLQEPWGQPALIHQSQILPKPLESLVRGLAW